MKYEIIAYPDPSRKILMVPLPLYIPTSNIFVGKEKY
jgi:hypothetical protein